MLTYLGISSLVFCGAFTWWASRGGADPRVAIVEAWTNICLGFSINFCANLLILPLAGASVTFGQNWWMGWIYTSIAVVRQYVIRRWFQERLHRVAARVSHEAST